MQYIRCGINMEIQTAIIFDATDADRDSLSQFLLDYSIKTVGSSNNLIEILDIINLKEPNILFLAGSPADTGIAKLLEKIKKQPTLVFLIHEDADIIKMLMGNNLLFLTLPIKPAELKTLLLKYQTTHLQLAQKMQLVLGKLKLEA